MNPSAFFGSLARETLPNEVSTPATHKTETGTRTTPRLASNVEENIKRMVVKFGGSSLADKDRIAKAARMVSKERVKGTQLVVVVSAMGRMTDQLIQLVHQQSDKTDIDDILAMGERTSVRVFAAALKAEGLDARYFDISDEDWPIITDDQFSNANPIIDLCAQRIREHVIPLLDSGTIPVIAGFIGRSIHGKVSTIGRGGSDTTALIIARSIEADEVVLVTDAEGIMSADPKFVPNAKKLRTIDVQTLIELADSGAKFIHGKALKYKDPDMPVRVISHEKDDLGDEGTVITGGISNEIEIALESTAPSMAVTVAGKAISKNPAIFSDLVKEIKDRCTLDGISADFNSVVLYVPQTASNSLLNSIHDVVNRYDEALAVAVKPNLALLKAKGVGLEDTPGIIGRFSTRFREEKINICGMLTLASSILVFAPWDEKDRALTLFKQAVREES